ncbi:unnamed protein product [Pleuronectes platessa]|uniref:Uncharacterized protein n=1 Tax=Pleuronectes platessa TaxID=8262 RepID=A0A9N7TR00_PLEPL|nr:unnamed protein product [Pleuronectes platessa]
MPTPPSLPPPRTPLIRSMSPSLCSGLHCLARGLGSPLQGATLVVTELLGTGKKGAIWLTPSGLHMCSFTPVFWPGPWPVPRTPYPGQGLHMLGRWALTCRFSACKVGWTSTSAEELLLVMARGGGRKRPRRPVSHAVGGKTRGGQKISVLSFISPTIPLSGSITDEGSAPKTLAGGEGRRGGRPGGGLGHHQHA